MDSLRHLIEQDIREKGPIPFSRYMELCLYHPKFGYYSRKSEQFGKGGDFYTSSDVHAVFGRLLARQFDEMWRVLGSPDQLALVELGPGRGLLAQDVLDWSEKKFPDFFRALHYILLETSSSLRERMAVTLKRHLESGRARLLGTIDLLNWSEPLVSQAPNTPHSEEESTAVSTIVMANEFFDALPVEILSAEGSLQVDLRDGRFIETWARPSAAQLEYLDRYSIHPDAEDRVEVSLIAQAFMSRIASQLERGFLLAIDYGYTREEQLAGRHRGTLKAIRQHAINASPYEAPGEQDITSDVNFTALAAVAEKHGWRTHKLLTQSQFLMGIGEANNFADAFDECRLPQERAKVALQLKHLVTPAGMGESFHVLLAGKRIETETFENLAGLSFSRNSIVQ